MKNIYRYRNNSFFRKKAIENTYINIPFTSIKYKTKYIYVRTHKLPLSPTFLKQLYIMSLSAEVRDLKKCLPTLSKLQKDYIKLVEDENEECVVKLTSYTELIDELKKHVKKESMKYSRMIITNPHFTQALEIENGKKDFFSPLPF